MHPNPHHIKYTALFIDHPETLLAQFPPKHTKVFAHHSTNWYAPTSLDTLEVGKKHTLKIIGQAYDEKAYALLVENPKSKNQFPHITISCSEDTSPVYSNDLLAVAHQNNIVEFFDIPHYIKTTEGYVTQNNEVILS